MLVKRNPIFPNIFDDLLRDLSINSSEEIKHTYPAVNIIENDDVFKLSLAAPGMNKKDFIIDIVDDVLTISSENTVEHEESNDKFTLKEYNFNSFKRSFNLPKDIIEKENIKATYKNGELVVKLPKKELQELKPKLIEVK